MEGRRTGINGNSVKRSYIFRSAGNPPTHQIPRHPISCRCFELDRRNPQEFRGFLANRQLRKACSNCRPLRNCRIPWNDRLTFEVDARLPTKNRIPETPHTVRDCRTRLSKTRGIRRNSCESTIAQVSSPFRDCRIPWNDRIVGGWHQLRNSDLSRESDFRCES